MLFILPRIADFIRLPHFINCRGLVEFESSSNSWFAYIKDDGTPYRDHENDDRDLHLLTLGEYRFLGLKLGDIYQIRGPIPNE